ncbi:transcription factor TFIIIC subunit tfc4 [Vermiconidia calcicola]|uniref:Transcription factor TFIIIC subunit tfc4 n=1 Tax=Vermiconidia calcicola TaxID=1690605 RepID=A0ACC3NEL7_9PEZI|nr:transcription factor TFIIIC subunit tfc4 [Vermiconidia calcicola]
METDTDTIMQDQGAQSYPDPESTPSTPYPSLSQSGYTLPSDQVTPQSVDTPAPKPVANGSGFTTLADYFNLGERALWNLNRLARNVDQRHRWNDRATENGPDRQYDNLPSTADTSSPQVSSSQDLSALPGYHFLPDEDSVDIPDSRDSLTNGNAPTRSNRDATTTRERGDTGGRPKGRGGWKRALKGTEHADLFKTPRLPAGARGFAKRGRPRGRGRGGARKAKPADADPEPEVKALVNQAIEAFINNDLEAAVAHASEAIQKNPEVMQPHMLVSQVREAQGLELESIHALSAAATVARDAQLWVDVANRLWKLKGDDRSREDTEAVLHCLGQALKHDNEHIEAHETRLRLYWENKSWNKARKECKHLAMLCPDNLDLLQEYAELCGVTTFSEDLRGAVELYEKAFDRFADQDTFGDAEKQWTHLNVYLDLINKIGDPRKGVYQLRRIARWFLGRKEDAFWDAYVEDDREYDETHERRYIDPQFHRVSRDSWRYGEGLQLELRVKLGLFRLQMGVRYHTEAFKHLEHLRRLTDAEQIADYFDLFLEVATVFRALSMYGAAVEFYDRLKVVPELLDRDFWMHLARCCREIGRNDDAEKCYLTIVEADPENIIARIGLVKLYEATSRSMKALTTANEIIRLGRADELYRQQLATYVTAAKSMEEKNRPPKPAPTRPRQSRQLSTAQAEQDEAVAAGSPSEVPVRLAEKRRESRSILPRETVPNAKNAPAKGASAKVAPAAIRLERPLDFRDESSDSEDLDDAGGDLKVQMDAEQEPSFRRGADYLNSLKEQKSRVSANYQKVCELRPLVDPKTNDDATQQWTQHAKKMAGDFRLMPEFYPSRSGDKVFTGLRTGLDTSNRKLIGEMEALKARVQQDVATSNGTDTTIGATESTTGEFHEIPFHEWHRILSTLALLYAELVDQDNCYDLLKRVLIPANVFQQDPELMSATLAVCLCCALMFNDSKFMTEIARRYDRQCSSTAVSRLVAASGRLGHGDAYFDDKKAQRWASKAVEEQDYLAMTPDQRSRVDWGKAANRLEEKLKKSGSDGKELDAGVLTSYAHMAGTSQHGRSNVALPYLFRALALQPENVVINLSIATTFIANALNKSTQNKPAETAQATAFLHRYYDLRVATGKACHLQEAEYNLGRGYHELNMPYLAMPKYEKVLELSQEVQKEKGQEAQENGWETGDFAQEAALALREMFLVAGNDEAALAITEEWLVM